MSSAVKKDFINAKEISAIAGHIVSMSPAIGALTRLMTRNMYYFINSSLTWFELRKITSEFTAELKFWLGN